MIETESKLRRPEGSNNTYPSTNRPDPVPLPESVSADVQVIQRDPPTNDDCFPDHPRYHTIDKTHIVETVKIAAERIQRSTYAFFVTHNYEEIDRWLDLHGLDRDVTDAHQLLARQAAFQTLLQTTLYEHHHRRGELPELSGNIRAALRFAHHRTEKPAFNETVLDDFVQRAGADAVADIVQLRHRLLASTRPAEDIARIYEAVVPNESRLALGQFRTLPGVAGLMRSWATRHTGTVLDPGLGAGALSSAYHPDWELSSDPERIVGIDRSPLSRLMGTTALSLAGQSHDARAADFLELRPKELPIDVDAVIANPPYTDSQTIDTTDKRSYRAAAQRATGYDIDAKTPLYAYFIYHSRQFLSEGDRMAVITPQAWLATTYGRTLKRFLLDEFRVKAFVLFNPESISAFDGPATTGLITFLEASNQPSANEAVRFVRIDDLSELETAEGDRDWRPVRDIVRGNATDAGDWGVATAVKQGDLSPERNWQVRFDPVDVDTHDLPSLGDFLTVSRGPTTGNVGFFCLSEANVIDAGLDERHLSKIVRRPSHIHGYGYREIDWQTAKAAGKDVWLLDPDEIPEIPNSISEFAQRVTVDNVNFTSAVDRTGSDLIEYLRAGVTDHGLTDTQTLESRPHWYRPRRKDPARVLVQSSGRNGFKFILNEATVRNTNACYGFYEIALSDRELKALLAYLNSDTFAEVARRHYRTLDEGFVKIEPNDLERVPVISPKDLSDDILATLADAFDELRRSARRDQDCSDVLNRIDCVLNRVI